MKINNITECMNKKQNEQKKRAQHTGCVSDGTDEGTAEVVGINVGVAVIVGAADVLMSKIVVVSCLQIGMNALYSSASNNSRRRRRPFCRGWCRAECAMIALSSKIAYFEWTRSC